MNAAFYHIRPMKSGDIRAVSQLEQEVFLDPWPQTAYIQELFFNENAYYFVLESRDSQQATIYWPWRKNQGIYGFVGLRVNLQQGHITTLAVDPDWRGEGLGELLLITVLKKSLELELTSVYLEVRATNLIAQSLYAKYNFQTVDRKPRYYSNGEDALLLYADINGANFRQQLVSRNKKLSERGVDS